MNKRDLDRLEMRWQARIEVWAELATYLLALLVGYAIGTGLLYLYRVFTE